MKHNGEKLHHCDQCEYETKQSSDLQRHKKTHSGKKTHHCNQCEYETTHQATWKDTRRRTLEKKTQRCTLCEYSCITAIELNRHMVRKHTGEMSHNCDQCNYTCNTSDYLQRHMKVHGGRDHSSATIAKKLSNRKGALQIILGPTSLQIEQILWLTLIYYN